ncbi:DUF837 domain-containing protein, protein [Aphelenchoides fujianensis]|nr:DUF837 domain-containing protein, protein [Aphelenchoides fujianensis]
MSEGLWNEITENLLADMRNHVQNLNERLAEASNVLEQSRGVNAKIAVMREYKDDANRHENREILALEEENRQMKMALEDVQDGMSLMMSKHRRAIRDFERSDTLFDLVQRRYDLSAKNNTYEKRFFELFAFADDLMKKIGEQHAQDLEKYSGGSRGERPASSSVDRQRSAVDREKRAEKTRKGRETPLHSVAEAEEADPTDPPADQPEATHKTPVEEDEDETTLQLNGTQQSEGVASN